MSGPSAWKLEQAMSVLMAVRQRLLDDDPEMASDEKLMAGMLEGESGDAMDVLDAVIRASIVATGMADEASARAKNITARATRYKARAEALRGAAFGALAALDLKRHERADFTASVRVGQSVVIITDEASLPAAFVRTKTEPEKALIAAALKAGQDVPGCELSNATPSLQVRTA
jgi:hypothetical protein